MLQAAGHRPQEELHTGLVGTHRALPAPHSHQVRHRQAALHKLLDNWDRILLGLLHTGVVGHKEAADYKDLIISRKIK